MKKMHLTWAGLIIAIILLCVADPGNAAIPEPDHIIYGQAGDETLKVRLEVGGKEIASYEMGANPQAGSNYVLRVPLDVLDPQNDSTARTGEEAGIFQVLLHHERGLRPRALIVLAIDD